MTKEQIVSVLWRFTKGGVAGAVASMTVISVFNGATWHDFAIWLSAMSLAGITGFITGGILALEKYLNWTK